MAIRNLIRRTHRRNEVPAVWRPEEELFSLQRRMNRLFDEFFGGFGLAPLTRWEERLPAFTPRVDVAETTNEVKVTAEIPGIDERDLEVTLDEDALTIRGEKREEREEKGAHTYQMERTYGAFHRVVPLPARVEADKAKATFKKGVLTVVLPKLEGEKGAGRKIEIKAE